MSYAAADALDQEGVQGTLCADARGLCVQAKGVADPNAAGFFTALVRRANTLAGPTDDDAGAGVGAGAGEGAGEGEGGAAEGLTVLIETEKL